MQLKMWMYDYAREQAPSVDYLRRLCSLSLESGYNALGIYFEHRFAFPSTPWSHGVGSLQPETVQTLQAEFPELKLIPFLNLLGHFEGMIYTETGKKFREELFKGMQACPSHEAFPAFARQLIDDTLSVFTSDLVHIGGDETWQLGKCPTCSARVKAYEEVQGVDGKAQLYGAHFGPLSAYVVEKGRTPGVWADMFLDHPQALARMPKETVLFNWQYFSEPLETSRKLGGKHPIVFCPSIQTYDASWMHYEESETNIREHIKAVEVAEDIDVRGVCLTTWECGLMGNYSTILPAVKAAGRQMNGDEDATFESAYLEENDGYADWARLMGIELAACGGIFKWDGNRSYLKSRLLLYSNPFLAWMHHGQELSGPIGDQALAVCEKAMSIGPDANTRGVTQFVKSGIEFVRFAEQARQAYAQQLPGVAIACLSPARTLFDDLSKIAKATHMNAGGSLADIERCRIAKEHVEKVILRIKSYGDGSLGYLPAFEIITHPTFTPHDQASWWLINSWARE